ncbi:hypothetical protein JG688_00017175, partial [Phytophthora aleatoria]
EDVIDFVDELQAAGAKKKLMLQFLRKKTDKHVTLRDVHNLLRDAEGSSKGNTATIYVDDDKLAQTITFQTLQMRHFLEALPQVLMVDATHNTNDARYNLFSFMIHDGFGHVSHSWGHLKEVLKPSMPLDECVDPLQFLQSVAEVEYAKKMTDVEYMCYAGADTETQKLAREVSQHAYQSVVKQYRVANDQKTEYTTREIQPHMIEMVLTVDTNRKYHLDTRTYHCSCIFVKTELLPYMHAIYWRLLANKSPIPIKNIHRRWSLTCPLNTPVEDEEDTEGEAACTSF